MALLTNRTLASGVTETDLIHVVITGDTSQNPAGSSYKATISQVFDALSGYCVSDIYVSNLHSCSPLNINPSDEGNVYFGSTSGISIDVVNKRIGINVSNPLVELHVSGNSITNGLTASTFTLNDGSQETNKVLVSDSNGDATWGYISGITGTTTLTTTGITTSAVTLIQNINYFGVNFSGDVNLTLFNPTGNDGSTLHIKDEGGNAGSYRIRITGGGGLIDGNSYVDMNINYMSLYLIARNGGWWII